MTKNNLTLLWKSIGVIAIIAACIDFYWVIVYNKNFFQNTGMVMVVLFIAIIIIRHFSER